MGRKNHRQTILICAVILITTVAPRLASLGYFPFLDDGYHAFIAQYIHDSQAAGNGFPKDLSGFKLYETLFAWLWDLPGNAFLWLRAADMLFAILAAWFFCTMLIRESGNISFGLFLAFAALCGLNLPGAIQSGFKHSFFPAFACLFLAVNTIYEAQPQSRRWFYAGALTALAVIFRETFFPFALLGCCALLLSRNWPALARYVLGGAFGAILSVTLLCCLHGQGLEIFDFYFTYGRIYEPEAGRRWLKFTENGGRAALLLLPLLVLAGAAFIALLFSGKHRPGGRGIFWLAAALLPIFEPMLKIGFLYHFTVCVPGLAGFCACAFRNADSSAVQKAGIWAAALAAMTMLPELAGHLERAPVTCELIRSFPAKGWPDKLARQSTTLEAARKINELLPANGTLSSTGFAYFIFPAAGILPPEAALGDLSRLYIHSGCNGDEFQRRLLRNPPDIVLIAHAGADHSIIFEDELKDIFDRLPEYERIDAIMPDPGKNYGWLGYTIYRLKADKMSGKPTPANVTPEQTHSQTSARHSPSASSRGASSPQSI